MAEHEKVKKENNSDIDHKHRIKQTDFQQMTNESLRQDDGLFSLKENPFHPKMDEHAATLSRIPFDVQRQEYIMRLNNTYGLRYVQRLLESVNAQAKLNISQPGDIYEQEADRVADEVTRGINTQTQRQEIEEEEEEEELQTKPILQRQPEEEELLQGKLDVQRQVPEEEEELQMKPDENSITTVADNIETRINSARGGGHPLSDDVKQPMEQAFGTDFSDVRTHIDSEADTLNQQLSARAFTTGQDIFFRDGEYSPGSDSGRKLIAHELTHVVQQNGENVSQKDRNVQKKEVHVQEKGNSNKIKVTPKQHKNLLSKLDGIIQRELNEKQIKAIGSELDSWPQYEQAKGDCAVAKQLDDLMAEEGGWTYPKLKYCVILYHNANRAFNLIHKYPGEEDAVLDQIEKQKGKMGIPAGNLFHPMYKMEIKTNPEKIIDYFRYVIDKTNEIWEKLDSNGRLSLARLVFDQEKGYDWARIEMEQIVSRLAKSGSILPDAGEIIQGWFETALDMHPFTLESKHMKSPENWLGLEWALYDEDTRDIAYGTWYYLLLSKSTVKRPDMPEYIENNRESLMAQFMKFIPLHAKSVVDNIKQQALDYAGG